MFDFNVVSKWNCYVYSVNERENSLVIRCRMSARKLQSGDYPPSLWFDVIAPFETCEVDVEKPLDEWKGICISVDGNFAVDGFKNRDGELIQSLKIFADSISEVKFEKKQTPATGDSKSKFKKKK